MLSPRLTFVVVSFTLFSFAAESFAQEVLTESFEVPDTTDFTVFSASETIVTADNTWLVVAESVDLYEAAARVEAAAFDGAQAIDLAGSPGAGVIEATFPTTPGRTYTLTFYYARNDLLGANVADAQVDVEGSTSLLSSVVQHDPGVHLFNSYQQFSDTFVADDAQAVLRFTSLEVGSAGVTIDAISITANPVVPILSGPALITLTSALSVLGYASIRRSRV